MMAEACFEDHGAADHDQPWWMAVQPTVEAASESAGQAVYPAINSNYTYAAPTFDAMKALPGASEFADWGTEWVSTGNLVTDNQLAQNSEAIASHPADHWATLHAGTSSDEESSPGSPVAAPIFYDPGPTYNPPPSAYGAIGQMRPTPMALHRMPSSLSHQLT